MKNKVKEGYGTVINSDGSKYMGEFKNDMRHGDGMLVKANGSIQAGKWAQDNFIGE